MIGVRSNAGSLQRTNTGSRVMCEGSPCNPITAGLSQEMDVLPDDNCIADACTYCHVFLDHIWSGRKLVWRLGDVRQE